MRSTPQEKCDAISDLHKNELGHCDSMIRAAIRSHRPAAQRMVWLRDVSDRLNAIIAPHTPCEVGCSQCCRQAVTITQAEADWISDYTGIANHPQPEIDTPEAARAAVARMHKDRRNYYGKPCPFLKDEACSVYSVRPIACRAHHSLADTPANCDTAPENWNAQVPAFDMRPLHNAVAEVSGALADIRDYFPT